MKLKNANVNDLIEQVDTAKLEELVHRLSKRIMDPTSLRQRIENEKRVIDMRKDPKHESWMELR